MLSNGRLVGVTPAARQRQTCGTGPRSSPASTYLYSVVAGPFTVLKDQWRGVPVEYWTYADTVDAGWRTFGETPTMIEVYSQVLGVPFPWAKYDQSIIPDFTYGGMENVSATTQTDLALHGPGGEPEQSGRGLNAHELAHQWFGDLTTTADWADIWLNEGITTYMESVENEKTRGWDEAALEWGDQQRDAMAADQNEMRPLVWGRLRRHRSDRAVLQRPRLSQGRAAGAPAAPAAGRLGLLGRDAPLPGGQRLQAGHHPRLRRRDGEDLQLRPRLVLRPVGVRHRLSEGDVRAPLGRRQQDAARDGGADADRRFAAAAVPLPRHAARDHARFGGAPARSWSPRRARRSPWRCRRSRLSFRFDEGGWLLGTVAGDLSGAELAQMAEHDLDVRGRDWALRALADAHDSTAQAARRFVVLSEYMPQLRQLALEAMGADSSDATRAVLRAALRDPDGGVRAGALGALAGLDQTAAVAAATALYPTDPSDAVRAVGARGAGPGAGTGRARPAGRGERPRPAAASCGSRRCRSCGASTIPRRWTRWSG